jgi:hypothetical protein
MPKLVFWNIGKQDLTERIAGLVTQEEADLLMLAECTIPLVRLLTTLNPPGCGEYYAAQEIGPTAFTLIIRNSPDFLVPCYDERRLATFSGL